MLNGQTILVVEAEFLIALDIQRMLEVLDVGHMLFARDAGEAHEMAQAWSTLVLAIVEIWHDVPQAIALIRNLRQASIPVVIITADNGIRGGHPDFPGVPVVVKPMSEHDLSTAVGAVLTTLS